MAINSRQENEGKHIYRNLNSIHTQSGYFQSTKVGRKNVKCLSIKFLPLLFLYPFIVVVVRYALLFRPSDGLRPIPSSY